MKLFYREFGGRGQPMVILHGFLGSSDNWLTQAKMFAQSYHVYTPDQRNHGQSPHSDHFDHDALADDIHEFLLTNSIQDPVLIGHSMGGKASMRFATAHPELVSKLVLVDIAPKKYPVKHDHIVEGLTKVPIDSIQSRNEADEFLAKYIAESDVRQFLLKNLQRTPNGGFSWKFNLPVLAKNLETVGAEIQREKTFEKPTLFVHGKKSDYVDEKDLEQIKSIFPLAELNTLDTGHWVQAEKPKEFVEAVVKFLNRQ